VAGHAAEDESSEIVLARMRQEQNVHLITGHYDAPRNKVRIPLHGLFCSWVNLRALGWFKCLPACATATALWTATGNRRAVHPVH